jgi:hypothetical protein
MSSAAAPVTGLAVVAAARGPQADKCGTMRGGNSPLTTGVARGMCWRIVVRDETRNEEIAAVVRAKSGDDFVREGAVSDFGGGR